MQPDKPDQLAVVVMDVASSLKLIVGELSAIAGALALLKGALDAQARGPASTPTGERNLDLEIRYPDPRAPEPRRPSVEAHNASATAPDHRGKHSKLCNCSVCVVARARDTGPAGAGEDELESARRRR